MVFEASAPVQPYSDRRSAGRELATRLVHYAHRTDVVVLALPRGGVPVAYEVAQTIRAPLDVFLVRKLGLPVHPELAMGAIASGGVRVLNDAVVREYGVTEETIDAVAQAEQQELERRERAYRGARGPIPLKGRTVVLVDDGLATGSTMRAAVQAVRALEPARVIVAVPVAAPSTCRELEPIVDEVVCARAPQAFQAVGEWYLDFSQTSDGAVQALLREDAASTGADGGGR